MTGLKDIISQTPRNIGLGFYRPLHLRADKWAMAAWLAAFIFFIYFFSLSVQDHQGFRTQLNDLGHMEQSLWSLSHGDWRMTVTDTSPPHSRLDTHANLIFYLLAPLYVIFPHPYLLFAIATGGVSLGGVFMFYLARHLTRDGFIAWLWCFLLLFNPMVHDAVLFDFHPVVLTVLLGPALFYLLEKKRWFLYFVLIVLLLTIKEDMSFLVLMLAPYVFVSYSQPGGLFTAAVAMTYWLLIRQILPYLLGLPIADLLLNRFQDLGATPEEMALSLLKNPFYIIERLNHVKIVYLVYLFLQGGYLAIFAPLIAIAALPAVIINLIMFSNWQAQPVGVYYAAPIVTLLLISSLYGYVKLSRKNPRAARWLFSWLLVVILTQGIILTPAPHGLIAKWSDFARSNDYVNLRQIKQLIPADASVAAQNNIAAHLAARQEIYNLADYNTQRPDYVLIHPVSPVRKSWSIFFSNRQRSYLGELNSYQRQVISLVNNENYRLRQQKGNIYLFVNKTIDDQGEKLTLAQTKKLVHQLKALEPTSSDKSDFDVRLEHYLARLLYQEFIFRRF